MLRRILLTSAIFVFFAIGSLSADCKKGDTKYSTFNNSVILDFATDSKDSCTLYKHWPEDTILGYYSGYHYEERTVTYFDPTECGTPAYPFEITEFSFTLFDPPDIYDPRAYKWPVLVDVVVYDLYNSSDSCLGPGAELCRIPLSCDSATYAYPEVVTVGFPTACCVDGPFFIGIEYTDPDSSKPYPSVLYDTDSEPPLCHIFQYYCYEWWGWYAFWVSPPGYPFYWVNGETVSLNCCPDFDEDGICEDYDNCPNTYNPDQLDTDGDEIGDVCDNCPEDYNPGQEDTDSDGVADACDNCPDDYNTNQNNSDGDDLGDVCDACPFDPDNDIDGDGICGDVDNCPTVYNPDQADADSDGTGDVCEIITVCVGNRGNINGFAGDVIDISDLVYLVEYMFGEGPPPPCFEEADVNGNGTLDIADLVYLVQYMFSGGPEPEPCP